MEDDGALGSFPESVGLSVNFTEEATAPVPRWTCTVSQSRTASTDLPELALPESVGGVTFDPDTYSAQLQQKCVRWLGSLAPLLGKVQQQISVFPSPPRHFRMRQKFSVTHTAGKPALVWANSREALETFPAASELICNAMPGLSAKLEADEMLGNGLRAAHLHSTLFGDLVVSLFYNAPLPVDWRTSAAGLRAELGEEARVSVMGHSKGVVETLGRDFVTEVLQLPDGRQLRYRQVIGSFSNPNARINEACLGWLCEMIHRLEADYGLCSASDLLELYCGNGNHTCALAPCFRRVLAVEINKALCHAATLNLAENKVSNAKILASDSAKFCFRVLRAQAWKDPETQVEYSFRVVLVDPPRQGLDATTLKLVVNYDALLYISCGADALQRDLSVLSQTHEVAHAAFFDHFAYTSHIETALCLVRRSLPLRSSGATATSAAAAAA